MDTSARVRAVARGRVQGVFFRRFVYDAALRLGLTGEVRNLPDGRSVETVAEGPQQRLEELLRLLRQGPPGALVEGVEVAWEPARGEYTTFRIAG